MDESEDPPEMSTRRGWLSALARTARSRAQEVSDVVGPGGLPGLLNEPVRDGGGREPARAPGRAISVDELIALAHDEGLTRHDDAIRSLARLSLRMTTVVPRCAEAWIETSDSWVDTPGSELLLAQINVGAASAPGTGLPTDGWLVLFASCDADTHGVQAFRGHGVLLDQPAALTGGAEPMALGPETVLPRPWHEAVQAVDFDGTELAAYGRLRARLQDLQGVEGDDDGGVNVAYHRLLGYPDETMGGTPSEWDASPSNPGEWRLLVQVSVGHSRRASLWIRAVDLDEGTLSDLRAFVH